MEYLNLHVSVMDSPEFSQADSTQRGTWLSLLRYLIGQENGDTIPDCGRWTDRTWLQVCKVTLAEVKSDCALWKWDGDNLTVEFYPFASEKKVAAQRKGGRLGNKIKAQKRRSSDGKPDTTMPLTGALTVQVHDDEPDTTGTLTASETEQNGTERNVTEQKSSPPADEFSGSFVGSETEAFAFCRQWPGEPASGTPPMDEQWIRESVARLDGRNSGWPPAWKRFLVSSWRSDWAGWTKKRAERNGGAVSANVSVIREGQERAALEREERDLRARIENDRTNGIETPEKIKKRRAEVSRMLAMMLQPA